MEACAVSVRLHGKALAARSRRAEWCGLPACRGRQKDNLSRRGAAPSDRALGISFGVFLREGLASGTCPLAFTFFPKPTPAGKAIPGRGVNLRSTIRRVAAFPHRQYYL